MKLQNIIFPHTDTCTEEAMYFRRSGSVDYSWAMDHITIKKNGSAVFDTYFNGFSAEKWSKYTTAGKISLRLSLSGKLRVTLMRKEKIGADILTEFIREEVCISSSSEPSEFVFSFDTSSTNGMFCFSLFGTGKESCFYGGSYEAEPEDIRHVKLAIDICTFKRERFIEANLRLLEKNFLCNPDSALYEDLEVFISDNAKTLDIERLSSDKIHIVPNKNAGGAGGFTRGMMEIGRVKDERDITHILVMDDDIVIEPESIFRTHALLSCAKEEYADAFVGGAMIRLDRRYIQTESGACWNSGALVSLKGGLDLRDLDACLYNETEESPQYNAWWYCAFPAEIADDTNLPLPIFIRGDDVEYGLRNMEHLILMNGICVWHEPFENKYSSYLYYYIFRNRLIDNCVHGINMPKAAFMAEFRTWVEDELRLYRYKNAKLLMRGVEDFFKGVSWLKEQDGESLHKDILASGYKLTWPEDMEIKLPFVYAMYEASLRDLPSAGLKDRIINHLTVNGTYLKPQKSYVIVPTVGPCQSSVYRSNMVFNYDYASRKGFVTVRDKEECRALKKQLKGLLKKIDAEYDSAVKAFAEEAGELMTREYWERYLGM